MRYAPDQTETVGIKQCNACNAELLERDKFCRRCGICQAKQRTSSAECATRLFSGTIHQSFSGALVTAVAQGVSHQTSELRANRFARSLVALLVTIPLWLMIVLLSPLEACLAARAAAGQVKYEAV